LGFHELETKQVPCHCLKCGAPAALWKSTLFFWQPPFAFWYIVAGYAVFLAMGSAEDRMIRVPIPLCRFHRYHWITMRLLGLATLAIMIAGLYVGVPLLEELGEKMEPPIAPAKVKAVAIVSGLVGWGILAAYLRLRTIRPKEITRYSIKLAGVAPEFEALHRHSNPFVARQADDAFNRER
jgi:hypothetical protein